LYQLTRQLAAATSRAEAVETVILQIRSVFDLDAFVFLRNSDGGLSPVMVPFTGTISSEAELNMVKDVFDAGCSLGANTEARALGCLLCLPLVVSERLEGVLAVRMQEGGVLDPAQHELLDSFAAQLAIVSEVQRLAQEERRVKLLAESERLQKTLFDSVSHELKTPIAAMRVALEQAHVDVDEIKRANDRLHRAVEHLLNATRFESGLIKPVREWCEPAEIVHEALAISHTEGKIKISIQEPLPLLLVDVGLAIQSLATILENAITHGSADPCPLLSVHETSERVCFCVSDGGSGIPLGEEEKIFEKFYRLPGTRSGGLGLGLAIARSFLEIQGGSLSVSRRESGGAVFSMQLPLGGEPQLPE
ncbi:MAG: ATP-binding protein, partial [Verrucomicrobiota bacterium]